MWNHISLIIIINIIILIVFHKCNPKVGYIKNYLNYIFFYYITLFFSYQTVIFFNINLNIQYIYLSAVCFGGFLAVMIAKKVKIPSKGNGIPELIYLIITVVICWFIINKIPNNNDLLTLLLILILNGYALLLKLLTKK